MSIAVIVSPSTVNPRAFGRGEGVEHHHQRRADRVGQQDRDLRIIDVGLAVQRPDHRVGQRLLPAAPPGPQHLQAFPGHDRGQPPGQVLDLGGVGAAEPQPGILHRVVGLGLGAEHPIGHRPQVGSLLLEALGQPVGVVHRSRSPVSAVHSPVNRQAAQM
jgi:hypothetical protein